MRAAAGAGDVRLDDDQKRAADAGLKGLIPFHGHPFLSYVLTSLADAGFTDVCIVTGPGANAIRDHYGRTPPGRLRLAFAVQDAPLGSAHALLAAESFCKGRPFAVINSDNHYPVEALRALHDLPGSGLVGFTRDGLLAGNIDAARIASYAIIEADDDDVMTDIIEKPDAGRLRKVADPRISMTCWRFEPGIFDAIRATPLSARGEYEIPDAVRILMVQEPVRVVPMTAVVLDLSRREDIPRVESLLHGEQVRL